MRLPVRQSRLESLIPDKLFRVSARGFAVYLLVRDDAAVLIGTGGERHIPLIQSALAERGLGWANIRAILLTHAGVEHNWSASWLQARSEAQVYINRLEMARLSLRLPAGARKTARAVLDQWQARRGQYIPPEVTLYVGDGDYIDLWYGLRVVHLPGPTVGHCGYYCRHLDCFFSGVLPMKDRPPLRQRALLRDRDSARESLMRVKGFGATVYSSLA